MMNYDDKVEIIFLPCLQIIILCLCRQYSECFEWSRLIPSDIACRITEFSGINTNDLEVIDYEY